MYCLLLTHVLSSLDDHDCVFINIKTAASGSKISVVGLQLSKLNPSSCTVLTTIEVVNIEPVSHPLPHLIPHSLRDVYSVREQSPWQLINLLAFCVTPEYLPQGSYHALKQVRDNQSLSEAKIKCGKKIQIVRCRTFLKQLNVRQVCSKFGE